MVRKGLCRFMEVLFSVFYSVPLFWLSTLAVIFFTTAEVTGIFNIFPSIGVGFLDPDDNLIEQDTYGISTFFASCACGSFPFRSLSEFAYQKKS